VNQDVLVTMFLNLDITIDNLEKAHSFEQLVTGMVANSVKALLKFENIVFWPFSDNQFIHSEIFLVEDHLNISYVRHIFNDLNFTLKCTLYILSVYYGLLLQKYKP